MSTIYEITVSAPETSNPDPDLSPLEPPARPDRRALPGGYQDEGTLTLHASYLGEIINNPDEVIRLAAERLEAAEKAGYVFDTIVGTGLSGALIVPTLARKLNKHFALVRKPDNSHSEMILEGSIGERWVFVDDLIISGATYRRVRTRINTVASSYYRRFVFVGAFIYNEIIERSSANNKTELWSPGFKPAAIVEARHGRSEEDR